jgi:nitrogen regulatory protein P-II 1
LNNTENYVEEMYMSGIVKIEVITGMSKLTDLIRNLSKVGVRGATVMQVLGCGVEMGTPEYEVEQNEVMELLPKQQINIVVEAEKVDKIVDIIKKELYTGHIGDGKIFIYDIDNVIRVRTGDEGVKAL